MNQLRSLILNGELERVSELITSINLSLNDGYNLLCHGVRSGNKNIVELLLERGAAVYSQEHEKIYGHDTPLIIAIRRGDVEIARMLLDRGASVNHIVDNNRTPLECAFYVDWFERVPSFSDIFDKFEISEEFLKGIQRHNQIQEIIIFLIDRGAKFSVYDIRNNINGDNRHFALAIENSYLSVMEHILKRGLDINTILNDDNGYTSLHVAVYHGNIDCVLFLLRHGANVNATAKGNVTPLHIATRHRKLEHVETLLNHGADVDAEDKERRTALYIATEEINYSLVSCILKFNPNVNSKSNMYSLCSILNAEFFAKGLRIQQAIVRSLYLYGFALKPEIVNNYTMLSTAMMVRSPEIVENFLKLCTDLSPVLQYRDKSGYTLLHTACKYGALTVLQCLLDKGADMNVRTTCGLSLICLAVNFSQKDIVELLLSRGVSVNDYDADGNTVLYLAAQSRSSDLDLVKVILKYRPDVSSISNRRSVRIAVISKQPSEIIQSLLDYGFGVEPDSKTDYDFLKGAISCNRVDIVEEILKYSCKDIMRKFIDETGYTLLHIAVQSGYWEEKMVELTFKYGVDINATDKAQGETALIFAIMNMCDTIKTEKYPYKATNIEKAEQGMKFVEFLLKRGADPNKRTMAGKTALHYAASSPFGMEGIVKLLLEYGAIVNPRSETGRTPLMIATINGNTRLKNLFIRVGGLSCFDFKNKGDRHFLRRIAAKEDLSEFFEIPLKLGADINSLDVNNSTILHYACRHNSQELVSYLLGYGPDVNLQILSTECYIFYRKLRRTLKEHVVKLKQAGLNEFDNMSGGEITNTTTHCLEELKIMENEKISDSAIFVRNILTNNITHLAAYANNQEIVQYIESEDCRTKFPKYANVLKGFLWRGIVKRNLVEGGMKLFRFYCSSLPHLPDVCIQRIFVYMGNENLRSFVRSHLNMFFFEEDTEGDEERDLLLDGVVRFDERKTKRINLEDDHYLNQADDDLYSSDSDDYYHSDDNDFYDSDDEEWPW